jgi:hypothetical protein
MNISVLDQTQITDTIVARIQKFEDAAAGTLLLIKERQAKLLSEDFASSFTYDHLLELDAKRWAALSAVHHLKKALEWDDETRSPLERLEQAIKWLRRTTSSYYPNCTSNISLEIDGRRHYATEALARELEDIIEYREWKYALNN